MTSILPSAKTGSARKLFEDPREAHWASSEIGLAAAGKSLTKAYKEFSVVATVNGSEQKLCFHFLNRGNSRDVFAAVVHGTTSLVMKLVCRAGEKGLMWKLASQNEEHLIKLSIQLSGMANG